jgi:hypothetical protein
VNQVITSRFIRRSGATGTGFPVLDHYIVPGHPSQHWGHRPSLTANDCIQAHQ